MSELLYIAIWAIVVFIISIIIFKCTIGIDNFLSENFGSECIDYIPYIPYEKLFNKYPTKPGTIFVSVASYRDPECSTTIESIYKNAEYPDRIYVGICEQNKSGSELESCINKINNSNITVMNIPYTKAKGPTYARYLCSTLWTGQEYYLQIDSHTNFEKHWDTKLLNMIKQAEEESEKPVLSAYPPSKEQMKISGSPEMDNGRIVKGILTFTAGWAKESDRPLRSHKPWVAAGFLFLNSKFMKDAPFDPNLAGLFQGEEVLLSARLFTNGWDFFVPNQKTCYHNYERSGSNLYHKDLPKVTDCRINAEKRVLFLLGLAERKTGVDDFLRDTNFYGLGNFRSINDYWKTSGVDPIKNTIERTNDMTIISPEFEGWNFRKDSYSKIKKWN